jgi:hypothetical protein
MTKLRFTGLKYNDFVEKSRERRNYIEAAIFSLTSSPIISAGVLWEASALVKM